MSDTNSEQQPTSQEGLDYMPENMPEDMRRETIEFLKQAAIDGEIEIARHRKKYERFRIWKKVRKLNTQITLLIAAILFTFVYLW